ncbi:signal recognition particle 19 kDa protein [Anopheles aquasalis]|uniref:signal recognition particle 19 kDa protein n=1 Tax=Anopheles aquasalis TaxID=42839 RepID=UPI00215AD571|nr:signal recognition particle 19 kDa protein [Anopheles aquasalis]XP_050091392.1 signal recognition particle 19 kDa protein [Anopheles aquasalis]
MAAPQHAHCAHPGTSRAGPPPLAPWTPDKKHSDRERWVCIYPTYINRKKTRQEGRRLPKENCVDDPSIQEIRDVLQSINMNLLLELKQYPRERSRELQHRGRVRVQLRDDSGHPLNPEYPTRDSLLVHVGKTIPMLKSRQTKAPEQAPVAATTSAGPKKGKGKRR